MTCNCFVDVDEKTKTAQFLSLSGAQNQRNLYDFTSMTDAFRGFDHVQVSLGVRSQPPTRCHRVFDQQVRASFVNAGQMFGVTLKELLFLRLSLLFTISKWTYSNNNNNNSILRGKKDRGTPPFHLEPKFRLQS